MNGALEVIFFDKFRILNSEIFEQLRICEKSLLIEKFHRNYN